MGRKIHEPSTVRRRKTMAKMCVALLISLLSFCHLYSQGVVVNGGFESGNGSGWTSYSKGGYSLIGTAAFFASTDITPAVYPHSGQYMGRLGGYEYEICSLTQTLNLPNTKPLYLKLFVQDRNSTTSECAGLWVGAQIRVIVSGQTIYDTYLCNYNQTEIWTPIYFDFSAAAGLTVTLKIQADAANSVWSFLYLDDISLTQSTNVEKEKVIVPARSELKQNYPNPFNPGTAIEFSLSAPMHASLIVYTALGKEVARLIDEQLPAGSYTRYWNAEGAASGTYFVRLNAAGSVETRKILLVR
jgi:hypothetical protein